MDLLTTGKIAQELDVHRDSVAYALRRLRLEPMGMAGQVRVYPDDAAEKVR